MEYGHLVPGWCFSRPVSAVFRCVFRAAVAGAIQSLGIYVLTLCLVPVEFFLCSDSLQMGVLHLHR